MKRRNGDIIIPSNIREVLEWTVANEKMRGKQKWRDHVEICHKDMVTKVLKWENEYEDYGVDALYSFASIYALGIWAYDKNNTFAISNKRQSVKIIYRSNNRLLWNKAYLYSLFIDQDPLVQELNKNENLQRLAELYFTIGNVIPIWPGANMTKGDWRLLNIPMCMLPTPVSNSEVYGESAPEYLGGSIKICGAAGDQQAALFGQKCFKKGDMKNTYGTGCFLLMNTGEKPTFSENGLVTTIGWGRNGKLTYALEGSVFMGGALIQWLRDELHMINNAAETEEIAGKVKDTNGCYIVPAFTGLGAPYWKPDAKGIICGLTRGVNRDHIVRAALDAIVYQVNDIINAMEQDAKYKVTALRVDGGASNNNYLCRTQADISDTVVIRPQCVETTALGAAYFAGLAVGYWEDETDIENSFKDDTEFYPNMLKEDRQKRLNGWKDAIGHAI